jgi:hypothetical protein
MALAQSINSTEHRHGVNGIQYFYKCNDINRPACVRPLNRRGTPSASQLSTSSGFSSTQNEVGLVKAWSDAYNALLSDERAEGKALGRPDRQELVKCHL